ncbi:MAG TPA: hypothetical protein VK027_03290 [Chitinophagaceae bacterium]|nr:hypothetical protein [Chitinophagaceae bacterium]
MVEKIGLFLFSLLLLYGCTTKNTSNIDESMPDWKYLITYESEITKEITEGFNDSVYIEVLLKMKDIDEHESPLRKYSYSYEHYDIGFNYFFNEFRNDVFLSFEDLNFSPEIYLFEPSQGFLPFETFVLGFLLPLNWEAVNSEIIIYNQFFNQGVFKLKL